MQMPKVAESEVQKAQVEKRDVFALRSSIIIWEA